MDQLEFEQIDLYDDADQGGTTEEGTRPGEEERLDLYCRDLYYEYKDSEYRQRKLDERSDSRKRYAGLRDPKKFPWPDCSNKSLMIDAIVIDNIEPRIMAQLFGDSDIVNVEPVGAEDVQNAESAKNFLVWALKNNMDAERQLRPIIHDLLLDGTQFVIPIWSEKNKLNFVRSIRLVFNTAYGPMELTPEQAKAPEVQQAIQMGLFQYSGMKEVMEQRQQTEFRVELEQVPMPDAFLPDTGDPWDEQPFLRLIYPKYSELLELTEENGGPYYGIDEGLILQDGRDGLENKDENQDDVGIRHSKYSKEVQLLECYVFWQGEWWLCTLAPDAGFKEVRRQPVSEIYAHAGKPVRRFDLFRESNESMGTGLPQKIKHFSTGADDLYNQMIDNGTIENMPYYFYEVVAGWNSADKTLMPGQGIPVPRGANIQFPRFNSNAERFMGFIELILQMQERLVSMMAYTQAGQINQGSAGSETYAGMRLLVNEGNIKHNYMGHCLRNELGYLFRDVLSLYGQYMPLDAKQRIFDDTTGQYVFLDFDLMAMQGQYDISINVSSASGNKMLQRQEASERFHLLGQDPMVDPLKIRKDFLASYDIKNPGEYLKPDAVQMVQALLANPELPHVVQQYLQQKTQQQRQQEIAGQAQANIERQSIERDVEKAAPQFEQHKLFDQVSESAQRKLITPAVEQMVAAQAMGAR
jgi:hypothetical protein